MESSSPNSNFDSGSQKKNSFFKSRLFSGFIGFILGILFLSSYQFCSRLQGSFQFVKKFSQQSPFQNPPFPKSEEWDPFMDEDGLQNQLDRFQHEMENDFSRRSHPFDSWFQRRKGTSSLGDLRTKEDEAYIYFEISIKGLEKQSLNVEVKDNQIMIKGKTEDKQESGLSIYQSFQRSFPVPVGVDSKKVEILNEGENLVLKFPKLKE